MRKQQLFPYFEKETPSVGKIENLLSQYNCYRSVICHYFEKETPSGGKIENLLSQYNCYRSVICHNLFLLTFLLFGPVYIRNKSGRLEVRFSVYN